MIELADEVVVGYASKGGMLERMLADEYSRTKLSIAFP
jgi:hypothetical protein